jgi:hypothetical protein
MLQSGLQSIGVNITWGALALNIQAQNGSSQKQSYLEYLKAHIAAYQPSSLVKWWFDFDLNNKQHQRMMMLCGGACLIASGLCFYYFKYKPIATLRDIADTMRKRNAAEDTRTRENDAFKRETIEVLKRIAQASEDRNKILKNGNNLLEVHNRLNLLQLQLKLKKFPLLTTDTHT